FGAVSGASSATCAAIGGVMIPTMTRQGYQRSFATALSACSGTTGALIPPSMVLLLYGVIANVSIEKLFMAGVIPGILFGLGLMIVSYLYAGRQKVPIAPKAGLMELLKSAGDAIFAIILILIIFGGIMGGIFTATEAAAVSVIYALLVGLFVYRKIKLRDLSAIFVTAGKTATVLSFLLCAAMLFQWVLTLGYLPQILAKGLLGGCEGMLEPFRDSLSPGTFFVLHKILVLIVLNISLLIVGMFLDAGAALLIVTPVLLPVGAALGINEVHFGVIVVTNLIIGLVTPPVGTTLFVASGVGRVRMAEMMPHVLKFLIPMFIVQILVTFVPWTTIALPGLYQWIKS
ncbi:MAG: TRAP transporter large permease, partial [Sedimentisphaerales bacterium]|nr:TRAP transporter large permease [Sedimentisphaerales bacterium]